jgi:hypothetical protein
MGGMVGEGGRRRSRRCAGDCQCQLPRWRHHEYDGFHREVVEKMVGGVATDGSGVAFATGWWGLKNSRIGLFSQ